MTATAITDLAAECLTLQDQAVPAYEAWRELAGVLRGTGVKLTKRRVGWGRTEHANPNANGTCGYEYDDHRGIQIGDPGKGVERAGGQNGGHYEFRADQADVLFFSVTDGRIYETCGCDGEWSNWQGSSSGYSLSWREYRGEVACLDDVAQEALDRLTARREELRSRKEAGAADATKIITALQGME